MRKDNRIPFELATGVCLAMIALASCFPLQAQSTTGEPQGVPVNTPSTTASPTQNMSEPPSTATAEEAADIYFAQGRFQAAIAAYKKVVPPTGSSWNKMGMSYQKMYNLEEAKKCYESALKINPKNVNYLNNLATVYAGLKLPGYAERTYKKALKIDPQNALVYKNLGTMYMTDGKINKGKRCYDEARKLDPTIFTARASLSVDEPTDVHNRGAMNYFLARSCLQSGQTDCAITYLRAAMNEGYTTPKKLATDPEFERLRGVYAFQQMLAEQNAKGAPAPNKDAH